jgi:hypothetical protein
VLLPAVETALGGGPHLQPSISHIRATVDAFAVAATRHAHLRGLDIAQLLHVALELGRRIFDSRLTDSDYSGTLFHLASDLLARSPPSV